MVQYAQPEAPPPPPPHPGMHAGMQQLPAEMERMNLQHGIPQYSSQGNSYVPSLEGRFTPHGHIVDPPLPYLGNGKIPITYEGWTFTKQAPTRPNEKASWALVVKTKMPLSQDELRDQVTKQRKKGKSVTDTYNAPIMEGFKKRQIDRLIADKTRTEVDPRFEYKLGALKLDQTRTKQYGTQTTSMQVILKRVFRSGAEQPLASGQTRAQELEGEIVDLTGADDVAYSSSGYSAGSQGQYAGHPYAGYVHVQPHDEHPHDAYYVDHGPGIQAVPHMGDPHGTPHHQQEQYMAQHDLHHRHQQENHQEHIDHHQYQHQEPYTPGKKEKKEKKKDHKPEVHQKKDRKPKYRYDSSSESASDASSSLCTVLTPGSEESAHSGHAYHHEKKHSLSRRSSRRDSRSRDHDLSHVKQVYRERRRKSPARSTYSGPEYAEVEIIASEGHRERPYQTMRTYIRDRPSHHQRALSIDDDRFHRPAYRQKHLSSYAHSVLDEHPHEEKERLKWEIEEMKRQKSEERRHKELIEADRLERQRLETEREKLEVQKERDRLARLRLENERYNRDTYDRSDRDRYARSDRDRYDRGDRDQYDAFVEREPPRRFSSAYDTRDVPYWR